MYICRVSSICLGYDVNTEVWKNDIFCVGIFLPLFGTTYMPDISRTVYQVA